MNPEADKLRRDLKRYRFLLSLSVDTRVVDVLQELIREAQERLRAIERDRMSR